MSQINIGAISEALNNKADDVSVVHKEYTETISGSKIFTIPIRFSSSGNWSDGYSYVASFISDNYSIPTETLGTQPLEVKANDGSYLGWICVRRDTSGNTGIEISARARESGTSNNKSTSLGVYINGSGSAYATAPTPSSATDNSTKIATTAHVVNVLKAIYPVGSVYIGTQNTCPMSAFFGTWTLVSSGKALWTGTGSNGNSTIDAGLPNITGRVDLSGAHVNNSSGALSGSGSRVNRDDILDTAGTYILSLDASKSNAIYGKSSTVQPPAYVVNVWRRTA